MIEFISQLPTEYQEVEYIESTGTQYIDTGYCATANTKVLTDVKVLSVPARNAWIFGSRNSDATSRYEVIWINSANAYRFYYGTNDYTFSGVPSTGELAITTASTGATINGVSVTPAAATISSTNSMYIFSCHSGTASNETSYMRLFSFKIYEGNTLMHDFVPCYRKSDNAVGLYDLVNGVFYTNAGTGDFAKGKNSNAHADVVITPGGVIPIQYALRRRMMIKCDSKIEFEYTGNYTDNRDKNGIGTVRFTSSGTLTVLSGTDTVFAYILGAGGGGVNHNWAKRSASGGGGGFQTIDVKLSPGIYEIVIGVGGAGKHSQYPSSSSVGGTGGTTTAFGYTSTGGTGGRSDGTDSGTIAGEGGSPNGNAGSVGLKSGGSPNGGGSDKANAAENSGGNGYVEITFS